MAKKATSDTVGAKSSSAKPATSSPKTVGSGGGFLGGSVTLPQKPAASTTTTPTTPVRSSFDNPNSQFYQAPTSSATPVAPAAKPKPAVSPTGNATGTFVSGSGSGTVKNVTDTGTGTKKPSIWNNPDSVYVDNPVAEGILQQVVDADAAARAAANKANVANGSPGLVPKPGANPSQYTDTGTGNNSSGAKPTEEEKSPWITLNFPWLNKPKNPSSPASGAGSPTNETDTGTGTPSSPADGSDSGSGKGKGNGGKGKGNGGGGWYGGGGSGGSTTPANYPTDEELLAQALGQAGVGVGTGAGVGGGTNVSGTLGGSTAPYELPEMPGANPERLEHVDTTELRGMLQQIIDAQKEQSQNAVDYNVQRETEALNRAMEDAAPQFQTQRDQVAADEMNALDNQALYAEARGDRGGIGEAQYASIQAAANQNRRAVNDAQVKLSTDTARQISDLRAKGEFEKADQLLSLTQSYLSQLMNLEQWALQENMSVDQFNSQLQKWVDEYNMNVQKYLTDLDLSQANLTGVFANGNATRATQNQLIETLANAGTALLNAGVLPSQQQLNAMGMTPTQAKAYIAKLQK